MGVRALARPEGDRPMDGTSSACVSFGRLSIRALVWRNQSAICTPKQGFRRYINALLVSRLRSLSVQSFQRWHAFYSTFPDRCCLWSNITPAAACQVLK